MKTQACFVKLFCFSHIQKPPIFVHFEIRKARNYTIRKQLLNSCLQFSHFKANYLKLKLVSKFIQTHVLGLAERLFANANVFNRHIKGKKEPKKYLLLLQRGTYKAKRYLTLRF